MRGSPCTHDYLTLQLMYTGVNQRRRAWSLVRLVPRDAALAEEQGAVRERSAPWAQAV